MAQEEYFLALARMFQQGQAEANQNALALSQMMKADKRYEADVARDDQRYAEGAPLREAQLAAVLAGNKATEAGTRATNVNTDVAEATAGFSIEKAMFGAQQAREALTAAQNANDPELVKAEIARTMADSLFSQYRAQSAKAQSEVDTDPSVIESKKQATIITQAAAMSDLRLKDASLDEFLSGAKDRATIRGADASKAQYEVAQQLNPAQLEEVKLLGVTAKRVEQAMNEAQLKGVEGTNFGNSLINLKRALGLSEGAPLPEYFKGAVETFTATKAAMIKQDASPEAIRQYGESVSQFVAALHSVGSKDQAMAKMMSDSVSQAARMVRANLVASGKETDPNAALSAISTLIDRATDGAVVAGFSPSDEAVPKSALESFVSRETKRNRGDPFATQDAEKKRSTNIGRQVFNAMTAAERDEVLRYFDVGQTRPSSDMDFIRLIGQHPDVRNEQTVEQARNKLLKTAKAKKR